MNRTKDLDNHSALRKLVHAILCIQRFFKVLEKFFDIFLTFAQNIDCWYMKDPPRRVGSGEAVLR